MINLCDRIDDIIAALTREGKLGAPTPGPAKNGEMRFGSKGSLRITIAGSERGNWHDYESAKGGSDPFSLIAAKSGYDNKQTAEWIRTELGLVWSRAQVGYIEISATRTTSDLGPILATYDYHDERVALLFQVVRYPDHQFRQRRPDGKGGWIWKRGDARLVLYHLPEVIAQRARANGHPPRVYITEGEKDCDRLRHDWGVVATCNPGGASKGDSKWRGEYNQYFTGCDVVILADNDEVGRHHAAAVATNLRPDAACVRIVNFDGLDEHGDVSDWLDRGGTQSDLEDLLDGIAPFAPTPDEAIPLELLILQGWLERDLAPPDCILGELLSTTSRAMLVGPTGLGKTMFGLAVAMAIAEGGRDFLHWHVPRSRRVLYVDGEMPRRLMKARLADERRRRGAAIDIPLFVLSREDFPEMPPLNTEAGQKFVDRAIDAVGGVDLVIFDNIQALIVGDMKEETSWQETLPYVRDLTRRRIGQLYFHHTGHETGRSYGTKTREWQLDTVCLMEEVERPDADISFNLNFTKARERTPDNRADFETATISLVADRWNSSRGGGDRAQRKRNLEDQALEALDEAVERAGETPLGHRKIPPHTYCVSLDLWQRYFRQSYVGEAKSESVERVFRKLATKLQLARRIGVSDPWIWRCGP